MHSLPILLKKDDSICFKGAIHPAYRRLAFALFSKRLLTDDSRSECTVQSIIALESIEGTFCILLVSETKRFFGVCCRDASVTLHLERAAGEESERHYRRDLQGREGSQERCEVGQR